MPNRLIAALCGLFALFSFAAQPLPQRQRQLESEAVPR